MERKKAKIPSSEHIAIQRRAIEWLSIQATWADAAKSRPEMAVAEQYVADVAGLAIIPDRNGRRLGIPKEAFDPTRADEERFRAQVLKQMEREPEHQRWHEIKLEQGHGKWGSKTFSFIIEVKVSRADFLRTFSNGKGNRFDPHAQLHYIMVPSKLVAPQEVPDPWGLLWVTPSRVYVKKKPVFHENPLTSNGAWAEALLWAGIGTVWSDVWWECQRREQEAQRIIEANCNRWCENYIDYHENTC